MENLFAYGTLMCEDIMLEVAGCCPPHCRGILTGYSRQSVKREVYPALIAKEIAEQYWSLRGVPAAKQSQKGIAIVAGVIYKGVPAAAWERLDRFEGEMYSRQTVQIRLSDKTLVPAMTYVTRPEFLDYLEETEWDFDNFLRYNKKRVFP